MTNPSTSTQEPQAGYQASGSIASADLYTTLSDGSEVFFSLKDGKTMWFKRNESGQILPRDYKHLRDMKTDLPQFVPELQRMFLNVLDFNGVDLPLPVNGLPKVDPHLGLLHNSDLASPAVNSIPGQVADSVGPLTGYFEMATPVGSHRSDSVREESFQDDEAQESFSITAEANNLNLSRGDEYFQQATPVSTSQGDRLSSSFHSEDEASSFSDILERFEAHYRSSFEFHSSVTETERSLERDIDHSLLWGEPSDFENRPGESPDD